jgi:hemerythrin
MDLEKINWKDEFSIGNIFIDQDHRKIMAIYNGLIDMMNRGSTRGECAQFLNEMTNYALTHFRKEETYMKYFSYPKFEQHRRYHMEYIYKVSMYNVTFSDTDDFQPYDMMDFLKKWWMEHIQKIDRDYEEYKNHIHSDAQY